jgi:hypothetical protein
MKGGVSVGPLGNISSLAHRVNGPGVSDNYTYYNGSRIPPDFQRFNPVWLNAPEPDSPASILVLFSWKTNATEPHSLDRLLAEVDLPSKQTPLEVVNAQSRHIGTRRKQVSPGTKASVCLQRLDLLRSSNHAMSETSLSILLASTCYIMSSLPRLCVIGRLLILR